MNRRKQCAVTALVLALGAGASTAFAQEASNYRLEIVAPADQAMIPGPDTGVGVRAAVSPRLAAGDDVEVLLDGEPLAAPGSALDFRVSALAAGTHLLQARIIDSTGNVGSISPPSFFYVGQAMAPAGG
jgi:hypothetical protein